MENRILLYAKKNIDAISEENSIKTDVSESGKLFIELISGRNFELSDSEIKYQAMEYLKNEMSYIENNF